MRNWPPFQHVNWHPDAAELRRFAVAMVVGFGVLGLLAALKHHGFGTTTAALWTAGGLLAAGGLVPGLGRAVYLGVYLPSSLVGYCVSHVLMTLIYFALFTPLALVLRLTGKDPLQLGAGESPSWWSGRGEPRPREDYYRQF